jgi:hypothetical protein
MAANRNMCRLALHKCRAGCAEVTLLQITTKVLCSYDIIYNLNILNSNQSGILRQRTHVEELKKYCVKLLEKFGSLSYTRHILEELDAEARTEVAKLGGNPVLENVLDKLLEWKNWTDVKKPVD